MFLRVRLDCVCEPARCTNGQSRAQHSAREREMQGKEMSMSASLCPEPVLYGRITALIAGPVTT